MRSIADRYGGTVTEATAGREPKAAGRDGDFRWAVELHTDRRKHTQTQIWCSFRYALDVMVSTSRRGGKDGAQTGVRSFDADLQVVSPVAWGLVATSRAREALKTLMPESMVANGAVTVRLDGRWSDVAVIAARIDAAKALLSELDRRRPVDLAERFAAESDPAFRAAMLLRAPEDQAMAVARRASAEDDDLVRLVVTSLVGQSIDAPAFHGYVRAQRRALGARGDAPRDSLALCCALAERFPDADLVAALEEVGTVDGLSEDAQRALARANQAAHAPKRPTPQGVPRARDRSQRVRAYAKHGTTTRRPVVEGLVVILLEDPEPTVRRAAAVGLLELDAREVRERIVPALDDPDPGNDRAGDWPVSAIVRDLFRRWDAD